MFSSKYLFITFILIITKFAYISTDKPCPIHVELLPNKMVKILNEDKLCACLEYEKKDVEKSKKIVPCGLQTSILDGKISFSATSVCGCIGYNTDSIKHLPASPKTNITENLFTHPNVTVKEIKTNDSDLNANNTEEPFTENSTREISIVDSIPNYSEKIDIKEINKSSTPIILIMENTLNTTYNYSNDTFQATLELDNDDSQYTTDSIKDLSESPKTNLTENGVSLKEIKINDGDLNAKNSEETFTEYSTREISIVDSTPNYSEKNYIKVINKTTTPNIMIGENTLNTTYYNSNETFQTTLELDNNESQLVTLSDDTNTEKSNASVQDLTTTLVDLKTKLIKTSSSKPDGFTMITNSEFDYDVPVSSTYSDENLSIDDDKYVSPSELSIKMSTFKSDNVTSFSLLKNNSKFINTSISEIIYNATVPDKESTMAIIIARTETMGNFSPFKNYTKSLNSKNFENTYNDSNISKGKITFTENDNLNIAAASSPIYLPDITERNYISTQNVTINVTSESPDVKYYSTFEQTDTNFNEFKNYNDYGNDKDDFGPYSQMNITNVNIFENREENFAPLSEQYDEVTDIEKFVKYHLFKNSSDEILIPDFRDKDDTKAIKSGSGITDDMNYDNHDYDYESSGENENLLSPHLTHTLKTSVINYDKTTPQSEFGLSDGSGDGASLYDDSDQNVISIKSYTHNSEEKQPKDTLMKNDANPSSTSGEESHQDDNTLRNIVVVLLGLVLAALVVVLIALYVYTWYYKKGSYDLQPMTGGNIEMGTK